MERAWAESEGGSSKVISDMKGNEKPAVSDEEGVRGKTHGGIPRAKGWEQPF